MSIFSRIRLDRQEKENYVLFSMYTLTYNILLVFAALFLVPYYAVKILLTGKYRKSIGPKFGFLSAGALKGMKGSPRIWIHAVSVGEVTAAAPVISNLREILPDASIVLSTSTETGQEMAHKTVHGATEIFYFPLDIPFVIRKVMNLVKPDMFVAVETEVWPNFMRICREKGIRIVMVNGRLSPRSFRRYKMTKFFWKDTLDLIDRIGTISDVDAERFKALGADPSKVHVMGNAKYDSLAAEIDGSLRKEISGKLSISPDSRVFVAGSTHEGEEKVVLSVYGKLLEEHKDLILIIVPRHVERADDVLSLIKEEGFDDHITMTEIRGGKRPAGERIIVIDVIGELFKVYSLATVVYCGGSLVPRGGQNILEPAAWGKVVFYGPSMEDFTEEKEALEEVGAGVEVSDGKELFDRIFNLLSNPDSLRTRGDAGKKMVASNMGASRRYAQMIRARS
jgi:3-deoxy-D-manno-octulosonic-acid transferase